MIRIQQITDRCPLLHFCQNSASNGFLYVIHQQILKQKIYRGNLKLNEDLHYIYPSYQSSNYVAYIA